MGSTVFPAAGGGVTQKVQEFTSTGTFTVPSNCSAVEVFLVGGGGGGGGIATRNASGNFAGGGGGGGGGVTRQLISVTPGASYTVTIGAGGSGGSSSAGGSVGGSTTFGSLATALGGGGGDSVNDPSTWYQGTLGATEGSSVNSQYIWSFNDSAAGGAGGNAFVNSNALNSSVSIGGHRFGGTIVQGAKAGITANSATSMVYAGQGIEGYGAGSVCGMRYYVTSGTNNIVTTMAGSGAGTGVVSNDVVGSTNGNAGTANRGGGGSGAVGYTDNTTQRTATGGAGGSGYARIIYWS